MLQLFKSKVSLLPIICILALMIFLRMNIIFNEFFLNYWQGDLAPFSNFLYTSSETLFKNLWFQLILSLILVFIQSSTIISIVSSYKTQDFTGFLIAWVFVMLMHLFPAFVFLSPQLFALTFILFAFRSMLLLEEKRDKIKTVFNTGLFIGIASSFWTPSIIFLLLSLFVLFQSKKLELRTFIVLVISFIIPYLYSGTYFLLTNQKLNITDGLVFNQLEFNFYQQNQLLSLLVFLVLLLISIPFVFQFFTKQLTNVKGFFNSLFFYIFCAAILFFIQNENNVNGFMFLIFPASLFLNILFNRIKRNFLAESIHLILLLSIVVNFLYFIK